MTALERLARLRLAEELADALSLARHYVVRCDLDHKSEATAKIDVVLTRWKEGT